MSGEDYAALQKLTAWVGFLSWVLLSISVVFHVWAPETNWLFVGVQAVAGAVAFVAWLKVGRQLGWKWVPAPR